MNLKVKIGQLQQLLKAGSKNKLVEGSCRYGSPEHVTSLPFDAFEATDITRLYKIAEETFDKGLTKRISRFRNLEKGDIKDLKVSKLNLLAQAFKNIIKATPHKWLFELSEDEHLSPYFVDSIEYSPPRRESEAHTRIEMYYVSAGERKASSIYFHSSDMLLGLTVLELLRKKDFLLESSELVAEYETDLAEYVQRAPMTGAQFNARGMGLVKEERWSSAVTSMERESRPTKVVMDDMFHREKQSGRNSIAVACSFWGPIKSEVEQEEGAEEAPNLVIPPTHLDLTVFDLEKHQFVQIHSANLETYEYDKTLASKLVLSEDKKNLVDMLVQGASLLMEDIVKGKTGGVIILATGVPGTGKTLSAEVYSEAIEKPLYTVQCSQLGTDEESLEKRLAEVLTRASRWKAILLIDEADVYVHERGSDIQQNAIVGVFLRVLEYYRGVLFLTSNRASLIDDAIISRATAHIHYELPSKDELKRIWTILGEQFKVKLSPILIEQLVTEFPKVSGRTVKSLLKLSSMLALRKKSNVDFGLVKYASQFLDQAKQP